MGEAMLDKDELVILIVSTVFNTHVAGVLFGADEDLRDYVLEDMQMTGDACEDLFFNWHEDEGMTAGHWLVRVRVVLSGGGPGPDDPTEVSFFEQQRMGLALIPKDRHPFA